MYTVYKFEYKHIKLKVVYVLGCTGAYVPLSSSSVGHETAAASKFKISSASWASCYAPNIVFTYLFGAPYKRVTRTKLLPGCLRGRGAPSPLISAC